MRTDADWKRIAVKALGQGERVQVRPRGHSMAGLIDDGDLVTLEPCRPADLMVGDVVLARVKGKRFYHVVLHMIAAVEQERFLIGSTNGRMDGWGEAEDILGKLVLRPGEAAPVCLSFAHEKPSPGEE